ncbi:MAG: RNA polymerase, sigma-24 subunit, ECF subfamily [Candidatus Falkowbacteria bacterium GW2011_GWA2_41_14]|uniref:RNA polymerase sigma factor n=1 Tax=Candidatus Falkowbacteria bacterium GW2011_GWA2_41_14 TaxID=1618635 RepID=A0A0G0UUK3_9BACT|nr:MAG: RNA polymerase, sigma-24 subunit, ECF subfamily [Candidatus Falkowbacteria bacterium GW2011_GWA2_41_14]
MKLLISPHLKPIYGFIFQYVKNAPDAEDITQEVFVKAWRNLKKIKQKNFKAWLFSVARNTSIDFLRKKRAIPFSEFENESGENILDETLADETDLPDEILAKQNIKEQLNAAINKLPPQSRLTLLLHYKENFTFQEIAEILHEPLNTVKSRYRRATIQLKILLSQN